MAKRPLIFLICATACLGCDRANDRVKQLEIENETLKKEIAQMKSQNENGDLSKSNKAPAAGTGPGKSLRNALLAANDGKYSQANEYIFSDWLDAASKSVGRGLVNVVLWDGVTKEGAIKDVEILREQVRGEGATVSFKIIYKDNSMVESTQDLLQENGKWRLSFLATNGLVTSWKDFKFIK